MPESATFMWNLGKPEPLCGNRELLRVEPVCETLGTLELLRVKPLCGTYIHTLMATGSRIISTPNTALHAYAIKGCWDFLVKRAWEKKMIEF